MSKNPKTPALQSKNGIALYIPTPCHEDWNAMTPVEQGRFCQSCAKQVVDFSMMTDQEVLNYFSKATGNTCGRFNNDQLQRPLQPTKIEKRKAWWVAAMMPLMMLVEKAGAQKKSNVVTNQHKAPVTKLVKKPVEAVNGELVSLRGTTTISLAHINQIDKDAIGRVKPVLYDRDETKCTYRMGGVVSGVTVLPQDTIPALIHRIYSKQAFTVYPNPAPRGSNVTIAFNKEGDYTIQLFDNSSKLIIITNYNAAKASLQTTLAIPSSLTAGMYYIRLVNKQNKKQYTSKLIVM